jgi:hexosaminidase
MRNIISLIINVKMNLKYLFLLLAATTISINSLVAQNQIGIIPEPASLESQKGEFIINQKTIIYAATKDADLMNVAGKLNDILKIHLGYQLKIGNNSDNKAGIRLEVDPSIADKEGYKMQVNSHFVEIRGGSATGLFYGIQSLRQLLPLNKATKAVIPGLKIHDEPRFKWRGMHLDVGRHFFNKAEVMKYIDYLAMYKLNIFHWHLTEDQGWRIEIKKYPRLTEVGSLRDKVGFVQNQKIGLNVDDGKPYGGFYTQAEIREVVAYAAKRYITIVPEIEMPGHSLAAMNAYPELCCFPKDLKRYTDGPVTTDIYCAGKEESFQFLENVLKEVFELFPGQYIHIGGDEAFKDKWKKCPLCQKRIKDEGLKNEDELQSWFIRRMEKFINANGKKLIGWDEILDGGLAPNAAVMAWRGAKAVTDAAKLGNDAVFAVAWPLYFSDGQNSDPLAPGNPGGNTLMKVYNCNPLPGGLTNEERKHFLGLQACLWSEHTPKFEHIEYQLFPRICALSEVAWSQTAKNWSWFYDKLENHEKLLDTYSINYSKRRSYTLDVQRQFIADRKGIVLTLIPEVRTPVYYTLDGSEPTKNAAVYQQPLFIDKTCFIKACVFDKDGKTDQVNSNFFRAHQAIGMSVNYGPDFIDISNIALTDGQLEVWNQFEATDLNFTIDLGSIKLVENIATTFKECTFKRHFLPESAEISVSADGTNFESIKTYRSNSIPENRSNPNRKENFSAKVGKEIRYIRLFAKNPGLIQGKSYLTGQLSKILLDEIIVD